MVPGRAAAQEPRFLDNREAVKAFTSALVELYEAGLPIDLSALNEQLREEKRYPFSPTRCDATERTGAELYRHCLPGVLKVGTIYMCGHCSEWHARIATGFVVGRKGLVITNYHVAETDEKDRAIGVQTRDGRMLAVEAVLASNRREDLALLKVDADDLAPLPVAREVSVGSPVYVISHADRHYYTMTEGIVSHMGRRRIRGKPARLMSITADFARGSSGAPVLNRCGAVVGVAFATDSVYYHEADDGEGTDQQMVWKRCTPSVGLLDILSEAPPEGPEGPDRPGPRESLPTAVREEMSAWFGKRGSAANELPASVRALAAIEKDQVKALGRRVCSVYAASPAGQALSEILPDPTILGEGVDPTLHPHKLATGDKVMPFYFLGKGDLGHARTMFIALHGGGSAGGRVAAPHDWAVNTREWKTQARLAAEVYPDDALYFVPRMADDNDGRWYYGYCQDAYDEVIRAAIVHHRVHPNRIYLIGISEGAYTAYRLGAFMADRWAGSGSMAGGEPLENAPPENMRNLAFRADIGERDTMYDRIGLNRRYGQALQQLQENDPDGFVHRIEVHPERGHGIDYAPCPTWLVQHVRDPRPPRIRWTLINVDGRVRSQSYWLAVDEPPEDLPIHVDARVERDEQAVYVTVEDEAEGSERQAVDAMGLRIYLDDALLDLDLPVRVVRNGREVFNDVVPRQVEVMMKSLAERGDPSYMFPAEIVLPGMNRTEQQNHEALP